MRKEVIRSSRRSFYSDESAVNLSRRAYKSTESVTHDMSIDDESTPISDTLLADEESKKLRSLFLSYCSKDHPEHMDVHDFKKLCMEMGMRRSNFGRSQIESVFQNSIKFVKEEGNSFYGAGSIINDVHVDFETFHNVTLNLLAREKRVKHEVIIRKLLQRFGPVEF